MFNEILTGQKSLPAETTSAQSPYRPDPSPSDLVCTSCQQVFPASQAIAGRCRSCAPPVDAAMAAMTGPYKADYTDYAAQERERELSWTLLSIIITIVLAVGWAFFKFGMRSAANDYDEYPSTYETGY